MSVNGGPDIIENGLVLYLDAANRRSYPTTGTSWSDISANNNTCTLVNNPTFSSTNGGIIAFNGTNQYGQIPSITGITDFSRTDTYTVSFWMYLNTVQNDTGNSDNDVVEKWSSSGGYPYVFRFDRTTNQLYSNVWNGSAAQGGAIVITRDTWWHICAAFNWPAATMTLYGNGGQLSSTATLNLGGTINNSSPLFLMRRGGGTANHATGRLASLSIYNRALSAQEVLQNFRATRRRFGV